MQHSLLSELQIAHTLVYILGLTSTCTHCSKSAAAFAYAKQPSEMVATSPPNDNKQPSQSVTKQTRTDNSSSSTSSSAAPSGLTGSNYASLNDDPDNLRVLIKEQEHELSPAQRAALLQLMYGLVLRSTALHSAPRSCRRCMTPASHTIRWEFLRSHLMQSWSLSSSLLPPLFFFMPLPLIRA